MNLKVQYFIQKHWKELLSLVFAIGSAISGYLYSGQPGTAFWISVILTIISFGLTLYFLLLEKDVYFIALDNYASKENWFGSGEFDYDKTNNSYLISETDGGFIFSKCLLWSDYSISGDFKILNQCFGVIVRATNLSNSIMLQIRKDHIRPHIRANGGWIAFERNQTGLTYEKDIIDGKWYKFNIFVKGQLIELKILQNKDIIINKSWKIPNGKIAIPVYDKNDDKRKIFNYVMDINVNYDYGSVGFRNSHSERALVKNLLISSIHNNS